MTKPLPERRCRWCARPVPAREGPGRPREFCSRTCRQRDYEARRWSAELGLAESELIVTRQAMAELHDALYVLEAAVEDVEADLAGASTVREHREAIEWLLQAARPLVKLRL